MPSLPVLLAFMAATLALNITQGGRGRLRGPQNAMPPYGLVGRQTR